MDMWAGYCNLGNHPNQYIHRTVNHSDNFIDPHTGVHTQTIEGFWGQRKRLLRLCMVCTQIKDLHFWMKLPEGGIIKMLTPLID
jgi:hypothetical protein